MLRFASRHLARFASLLAQLTQLSAGVSTGQYRGAGARTSSAARDRYQSLPRTPPPPRGDQHGSPAGSDPHNRRPSFPRGASGSATSACAICLGRHPHKPREYAASLLHYYPSQRVFVQLGVGGSGLYTVEGGESVCLRHNIPSGCTTASCAFKHICSGCGSAAHGAQGCPYSKESITPNSAQR